MYDHKLYVWHDSLFYVSVFICDSIIYVSCMSHVTHIFVRDKSYMWHDSLINVSFSSAKCASWHVSHVTNINESCHTYEWAKSHIWMSHITHANGTCQMYQWVMWHISKSHVTRINESSHTYQWLMSHIWKSQVTYMSESRTHINGPLDTLMSRVTRMNEWMNHVIHIKESMSHAPHMSESRTHINAPLETLMSHISYGWVNEPCDSYQWVASFVWRSHVTHSYEWMMYVHRKIHSLIHSLVWMSHVIRRGGGLGSRPIFKKFNEPYAPS